MMVVYGLHYKNLLTRRTTTCTMEYMTCFLSLIKIYKKKYRQKKKTLTQSVSMCVHYGLGFLRMRRIRYDTIMIHKLTYNPLKRLNELRVSVGCASLLCICNACAMSKVLFFFVITIRFSYFSLFAHSKSLSWLPSHTGRVCFVCAVYACAVCADVYACGLFAHAITRNAVRCFFFSKSIGLESRAALHAPYSISCIKEKPWNENCFWNQYNGNWLKALNPLRLSLKSIKNQSWFSIAFNC